MCSGCIQTTTQAAGSFVSSGGPLVIASGLLIAFRIAWGYNIARIRSSRPLQVALVVFLLALVAYLGIFTFS
jgi:hypothetical protein